MILLLSLFTFTSFDGGGYLTDFAKILIVHDLHEMYIDSWGFSLLWSACSSSSCRNKCWCTIWFNLKEKSNISKLLSYIFRDQSKIKCSSSPIDSIDGNLKHRLKKFDLKGKIKLETNVGHQKFQIFNWIMTCRFHASLNHKDDGQKKFIKPNSQR